MRRRRPGRRQRAGKSTLLRLVATLLQPDRGRVVATVRHPQPGARIARGSATCRPPPGLSRLSGLELLRSPALFPLTALELERRIAAMIELFGLGPFLHQRIAGLSPASSSA